MGMFNDILWNGLFGLGGRNTYFRELYKNTGTGWNKNSTKYKELRELLQKYNISESDFMAIVNQYKGDTALGSGSRYRTLNDIYSDLKEMDTWDSYVGTPPQMPDTDAAFNQAVSDIDAENTELSALYDTIFNNQKNNLNQNLIDNTAAFADYRNQTLTNNAMNQQAIAGSTRYELDRQQRNAITRGASAAQRLVANINAQLGTQAQSAQQSLDTSNALAQQLIAHRQAQTGIRNDYNTALENDASRRAGLVSGRSERINNLKDSYLNTEWNKYESKQQAYNDRLNSLQGTNPFSSAYSSYKTKQSTGL